MIFDSVYEGDTYPALIEVVKKKQQQLQILTDAVKAANEKLAEYGWVPFGTNANNGAEIHVIFSSQVDEAGMPYFERVTS